MAGQFTFTQGPLFQGEAAWIIRAMMSLPVPLSPCIRTGTFAPAILASRSRRARIASVPPNTRVRICIPAGIISYEQERGQGGPTFNLVAGDDGHWGEHYHSTVREFEPNTFISFWLELPNSRVIMFGSSSQTLSSVFGFPNVILSQAQ